MYAKKAITAAELKKLVSKSELQLECPSDKGYAPSKGKFTFYKHSTENGKVYTRIKCDF